MNTCLYAHYNAKQEVSSYVFVFLKQIQELGFDIIFISNSAVQQRYRQQLEVQFGCTVIERENKGNDFGAWQHAINNRLIPEGTEQLLLTNDSIFGPLFDLEPFFQQMSEASPDYWGFTDSIQGGWHLQSYFLCLSRKVFTSHAFHTVFSQDFGNITKKEIIRNGEILLSQTLQTAGFEGKTVIRYDDLARARNVTEKHNPTHYFWRDLIEKYRFPFIKKDLLIENPEDFPDILDAYDLIAQVSSYNLDLVKEVYIATKKNTARAAGSVLKPLVLCHIFFTDIALHFIEQLTALSAYNAFFVFNISEALERSSHFSDLLKGLFPNSIIINMPNKGRDIGGKLSALDLALKLNVESDVCLVIHDKKSQHIDAGALWRDELFKIIDPANLPGVFRHFADDQQTGIVCSKRYIQNEYIPEKDSFGCTSGRQLKHLIEKYSISTKDYNFVAGNIFWIRSSLFREFFAHRSLYDIRAELEMGNALDFGKGTYIHAWERAMSWIATSQGYKIYGI